MIGDKLKQLREQRDYSQGYVADTLGISRVNYNRYENNKNRSKVVTNKFNSKNCVYDTRKENWQKAEFDKIKDSVIKYTHIKSVPKIY